MFLFLVYILFLKSVLSISNEQYKALVSIYTSLNGPNWLHNRDWPTSLNDTFITANKICNFTIDPLLLKIPYGIVCTNGSRHYLNDSYLIEDSSIEAIELNNNNLTGTIPKQIKLLNNSLKVLDFSQNQIVGSLPNEIYQLNKLVNLS